MADPDIVIGKIVAIYEGHDKNKYCAKFVVHWLVFTSITLVESSIENTSKLTLVAIVVPIVEKLAQWSQNTCWRSELEHYIHCLRFLEDQRG
jgi:hypothetical protein